MEDLAGMVQRGFAETKTNLESFKEVNAREHRTMTEVNAREHRTMTENNTREHEEIKLRLDNVAYRFELVELQRRVQILEKKIGIKK